MNNVLECVQDARSVLAHRCSQSSSKSATSSLASSSFVSLIDPNSLLTGAAKTHMSRSAYFY